MHFSTKPMQKFGFKGFFRGFVFAYFLDCVLWSKLIPTLIIIGRKKFLGRILIFCFYSQFDIKLGTRFFFIFPLHCWITFILWDQTRIDEIWSKNEGDKNKNAPSEVIPTQWAFHWNLFNWMGFASKANLYLG